MSERLSPFHADDPLQVAWISCRFITVSMSSVGIGNCVKYIATIITGNIDRWADAV